MPRPYSWLVTALVLCTACGGGGGGEPDSAGAIEPVLKAVEPPSPASTAVLAATVPYLAERSGATTALSRHGDPVPATPVEEEGSVTTSGLFDFFTAPFDLIGNLFGGGGGDDGPTLNDYFPTGTDDEWTYLEDAEILQGADPASLFPDLARGNKHTWGFTLQAQKEGLFFVRQEVDGGTITANPPLMWIRNKPGTTGGSSSSDLTYTPTGGGPPITVHVDRTLTGSASQPHTTLHSSFADTVRVVVKDRVTDPDGTNARSFQYTYYLARGFGMVECTLERTALYLGSVEVLGHAEIEWGRVNGREGPDTDGDGIRDSLDDDDDGDGIPDDHLGSTTPGNTPCTGDTANCDDALPKDGTEQADADGDGLGNLVDPDGDNDSFANDGGGNGIEFDQPCTTTALGCDDAFPFDAAEWADADGDGLGNIADLDDDNDGRPDVDDPCPYTPDPCPASPASPSDPVGTTTPLATSGDPTPRGDLRFATFDPPQMNRGGEVGFQARALPPGAAGEGTRGLFLADDNALATVVRGGDPLPGGNDEVARPVDFALNEAGTVALTVTFGPPPTSTFLPALTALLRGDATGLTEIARVGDVAPDGVGTLNRIDSLALNNLGSLAFRGSVHVGSDYLWVIYRRSGTTTTRVMIEGQPAPDGSGPLTPFDGPLLNDLGQVVFRATIGTEPFSLGQAILRSAGTDLAIIAQHFVPLDFPEPRLNNRGEVVFPQVTLVPGSPLGVVIRRDDGSTLTPIVETGDIPAGAQHPLISIAAEIALNDGGAVAFAGATGDPATSARQQGIFVADHGAIQTIVQEGDPVPGGAGTFASFRFGVPLLVPFAPFGNASTVPPPTWAPPVFGRQVVPDLAFRPLFPFVQLTETGTTAFRAAMGDTAAGIEADQALFLGDPDETITAVRVANPLVGSRVAEIDDFALNDRGQVAYTALLADGREGLFLFTPDLHWRSGDGLWDDHTNWTVGLQPADAHAVTLGLPVTVTGPAAPTRIRGLTVTGGATLALHPGGPLTVTSDYTQEGSATLAVELAPGAGPAITTTGTASLAGTLRIALADGTPPLLGDRFEVISAAGGVTGAFAAVDGGITPTGLLLRIERDATTLALVATLP